MPDAHAAGYIPRGLVVMDQYGRFVPAPNRFPDSVKGAGFKPLADYVHSKGLKVRDPHYARYPLGRCRQESPIKGSPYHTADIANEQDICRWKGMEDTYGIDVTKPGAQAYYDSIARLYAHWAVDYVKADDKSRPYHKAEIHALIVALKKTGHQDQQKFRRRTAIRSSTQPIS